MNRLKHPATKPLMISQLLYALLAASGPVAGVLLEWDNTSLSRLAPDFWNVRYWHFVGLIPRHSEWLLDGLRFAGIGLLGWLYWRALHTGETVSSRWLWGWVGLTALLLGLAIPFHSSDLYGYFNRGLQQSLYQLNPYLVTVSQMPHWTRDPMLHPHWIDNPCPYGFAFAALSKAITGVVGQNFMQTFLAFKLLNGLGLVLTLGLGVHLAGILGHSRTAMAWLAGASPLVLLHVMANGHNDILMAALLMASLAALAHSRWDWAALPLLMLSILIKYITVLALPFIGLYLIRQRRWLALGLGLALGGMLLVGLSSGYVQPGSPWPWRAILENAGKPQHSLIAALASAVYYPAKWLHLADKSIQAQIASLLKPLFLCGFAGFMLWRIRRFWQGKTDLQAVVFEVCLSLLVLLCAVSAKFHAWYLIMFFPLLPLLPETSRLRHAGLWLGLFQLAAFTPIQNIPVANWLLLTALPLWLGWREVRFPGGPWKGEAPAETQAA